MTTRRQTGRRGPIIAVAAGRRIDSPGAIPSRFPVWAIPRVEAELRLVLRDRAVTTVVSSAACGADILVLEAAAELTIRTRIVLPFSRERFRHTSVVDRGLEWGARFEHSSGCRRAERRSHRPPDGWWRRRRGLRPRDRAHPGRGQRAWPGPRHRESGISAPARRRTRRRTFIDQAGRRRDGGHRHCHDRPATHGTKPRDDLRYLDRTRRPGHQVVESAVPQEPPVKHEQVQGARTRSQRLPCRARSRFAERSSCSWSI